MFRNILVPTDFSPSASRALGIAVRTAAEGTGRITLLHVGVVPLMVSGDLSAYGVPVPDTLVSLHEDLAKRHRAALEDLAKAEIPEVIPWTVTVQEGYPPEVILDTAKAGGHDLIVLGTHGRTGLERVLLGSVAERVIRGSELPVLVVH